MWLAMLMLAAMASGSACPDYCQCRPPKIECRGHAPELSEFDELPANFTQLLMHDIPEGEFITRMIAKGNSSSFLNRLQAIEVTNCSSLRTSSALEWQSVGVLGVMQHSLPDVNVLNISRNKLDKLPKCHVPINGSTSSLRILDAGSNQIERLSTDFHNLTHLVWLSLANNKLNHIVSDQLKDLKSLEFLDLSNNYLHTLQGVLDPLCSLQRLYVAGNKFEHIGSSWFQNLSKLVELDISRNKLTFILSDALQPLAGLSVFKLAENPLIERDLSLLLGTGRRLEIVDASRIGLLRVPAALTRSIRILKLAGNQLTSINSGDLDSYPLLKVLDLTDNRLIIIEDDALGRLDNLEELILSGNILPTIPKSLSSSLKILDLRQNAISKLKANDLQELYLLSELNLSGNVITVIEGGFFRQLPALKLLDISDNPIKTLPSDTLNGASNLIILRMSGLMSLKTEENQNQDTAFPYLTPESLIKLDVSRSPALAAQLLADNAALSACKSLQELDLSYANVSSIRSDLEYVLPQLRKLHLIGNEWNCTEDQFWLGDWIRMHSVSIKFSTRCAIPYEFEGKLLEELPSLINSKVNATNVMDTTTTEMTMSSSFKLENRILTYEIVDKIKLNASNVVANNTSVKNPITTGTPATVDDLTSRITNVISSSKIASTTTTQHPEISKKIKSESSTNINKPQILLSSNKSTSQNPITVNNAKDSLSLLSVSNGEGYTSEAKIWESTRPFAETTPPINTIKSSGKKQTAATESITSLSPLGGTKKVMKNTFAAVPTPPPPRDAEGITKQTTNVPSTLPSTTVAIDSSDTSTITATTAAASIGAGAAGKIVKSLFNKPRQATLIKLEDNLLSKQKKNVNEDMVAYDKKSSNSVFSEFSHSKLLFANEEGHINDEPNSVAEELNSQATESGARTSESLASGAHPGMLVLLGAAIGAAAALTVVLSRRATVSRRDRQYQRHENIEVHALTPTTELW